MIDFTGAPRRNKTYAGASGSKISIIYKDVLYMLKFPAPQVRKADMGYTNSCISEYIGCKIYESIGIPVQEVLLGTYTTNKGKEKIVVACKDLNQGDLNDRVFNRPTSAIVQDGKRINYFDFISSLRNKDCNSALKRIEKRIDMEKVNSIIDETPFITDAHKEFLKTILKARKERILDYSVKKLERK